MRIVVTTGNSERGQLLLGLAKCELGEHWVGTLIQSQEPCSEHKRKCKLIGFVKGIVFKTFSYVKGKYKYGIRGSSILQKSVYSFLSGGHRGHITDRRERMGNIHKALRHLSKGVLPLPCLDSPGVKFSSNPNDPSVQNWLVDMKPDLVLVFGGVIVNGAWLNTASFGIVNMHFGILPYYRCSWSTEFAIYQERWDQIGATVHYIDKGVDTGQVISIHPVEAGVSESIEEILAEVYWKGLNGLISAAKKIIAGQSITGTQVSASNSYFPSRSLTPWHKAVIWLRMSQRSIPWPKVQSSLENVPVSKYTSHISKFFGAKDKYPPGIYILLYHSLVDDSNNSEWEDAYEKVATSKNDFYNHIEHMLEYMAPLPLSGVFDKLWRDEVDRPYFVITFDDGYVNIRDVAPVLKNRGIRPCVFVNADFASNISVYYRILVSLLVKRGMAKELAKELNNHIASVEFTEDNVFAGTKNHYCYKETENAVISSWKAITGDEKIPQAHLSWDDLQELHCMGWQIGNHTLSHPILSGLKYEDVQHQIEDNHVQLIDKGLEPLKWISYPNGLSKHVDEVTEQWMNRNTDFNGIHAGGGVNFFPSRTEWLRIPIGNHPLDQFKWKIQSEIKKTFSLFKK
jgi:peptidoglycan/xylan/chitin deacetylase (PgdA/CDA1 family)/folate-dependent phosphoribosylglycinamide formyltransferase PurN